ncbi:MAG: GNAT family N-acetyltransferase [Thermoplasmatota archaeon]
MIRPVRYDDLPAVMAIAEDTLTLSYTLDFFVGMWQLSPEHFLVAERDNTVAGFILGVVTDTASLRILLLCVTPQQQRQGIGSALLQHICTSDLRHIHLEVRADNPGAIAFYRRHGFAITERLPDFYPDGTDGYRMEQQML